MHIKSGMNCLFFDQFQELVDDIKKRALVNNLTIISTFSIAEESFPNKG